MTPTARTRPPVATPSRRPSGVVRATPYVKLMGGRNPSLNRWPGNQGTTRRDGNAACDRAGIRAEQWGCRVVPAKRGALSTARSNPTKSWGFKRLLRATYFNAAAQTIGVNRAPSLEMVIGVAAPPNAVSNVQRILHGRGWQPIHAGRCGCDTYTWRAIPDRQSAYWTQKHLPARVVGMTAPIHPALRAPGFRPTDAGGSFFAMRELMAGAR